MNNVEMMKESVSLKDVMTMYGFEPTRSTDSSLLYLCPLHGEDNPSFSTRDGLFFCHGCKEGGDVIALVMKMEKVDFSYAMKRLSEEFDIKLDESSMSMMAHWTSCLDRFDYVLDKESHHLLAFCRKRGLDYYTTAAKYRLSWSDKCYDHDLDEEDVARLGLSGARWNNALVVPLRDERGRLCGHRTRKSSHFVHVSGKHPVPVPPVYGIFEALPSIFDSDNTVHVVEGEVDVWQMNECGWGNVVGSFGTTFGSREVEYLRDCGVERIIVIPDGDAAGRRMARKVAKLPPLGVDVLIASIEEGDPDEMLKAGKVEELAEAIDNAVKGGELLADFWAGRSDASDPLSSMGLLMKDAPDIGSVALELAARRMAETYGISPESLMEDVNLNRTALFDSKQEEVVARGMTASKDLCIMAIDSLSSSDFSRKGSELFDSISSSWREEGVVPDPAMFGMNGTPPSRKMFENALESVQDLSLRRRMEKAARSLSFAAKHAAKGEASSGALKAMGDLSHMMAPKGRADDSIGNLVSVSMRELRRRMSMRREIVGFDLGDDWKTLNKAIHGLQRGRYAVIAAPSGVGKTSVAVSMASELAVRGDAKCSFVTLELDKDTLVRRIISNVSRVSLGKMATGMMSDEEGRKIRDAARKVGSSPLSITSKGRTPEELRAFVCRERAERGLDVLFVDFIQLMKSSAGEWNKTVMVGEASRSLLDMAIEFDMAVVALAQVNRDGSKKHELADHTDVGEAFKIAQDADIFVTMTTKNESYDPGDWHDVRMMRLNKNRRDGESNLAWTMKADLSIQRLVEEE